LNNLVKEEKTIQLEIKINTYYNSQNWSKTIQSINKHSNPSVNLILMRGKCYYNLEQFENLKKLSNLFILNAKENPCCEEAGDGSKKQILFILYK
jgi:hypothetical protein